MTVRSYLEDISEGEVTPETLKRMYRLADQGKTDATFQRLVYGIVNRSMHGRWKDYRGELDTIFNWFKSTHDYRKDPVNVELLQDVFATMDRKRFDCDDGSIFLCAASEILGAPCRFVTVSTRPDRVPSHVYVEAYVDGAWTPMDPSVQWSTFGWGPTEITDKKIWPRESLGMSGYGDHPSVEGIGMQESNPQHWTDDFYRANGKAHKNEEGFAQNMFVVNPTGDPNDVSQTFAAGQPGSEIIMARRTPSSLVNSVADQAKTEQPGGGDYYDNYPIIPHPLPGEVFTTIPASEVPMELDPTVWTGKIPDGVELPNYIYPQRLVREEERVSEFAGLAGLDDVATDASKLGAQVVGSVTDGLIPASPSVINQAIDVAVGVWAAKQQTKLSEAQAKVAQAQAVQATAQAEVARQQAMMESGVPIYKRVWFWPVVGAAAVFLFKGGATLLDFAKTKRRRR